MRNYNFYQRQILKLFGGIHLSGCVALAHMMVHYKLGDNLTDTRVKVAEAMGSTPIAIERVVRTYVEEVVMKTYDITTLSNLLDYEFKTGKNGVIIGEFIPALKLLLDNIEE